MRLFDGLDIGYSSDRRALEEMTKGRALAENFSRPEPVRAIFENAIKNAPTQAFLHQQWAIFELNQSQGSIADAEKHAARAHELDPRSKSILHSRAEIDRRRANEEAIRHSSGVFASPGSRAWLSQMPAHDRFVRRAGASFWSMKSRT